jgi:hypothetical protein
MLRVTGAALLIAIAATFSSSRTADADLNNLSFIESAVKVLQAALPLITEAQIKSVTSQLDKMNDASLYLLKAAPDSCKVPLVLFKCDFGITNNEVC